MVDHLLAFVGHVILGDQIRILSIFHQRLKLFPADLLLLAVIDGILHFLLIFRHARTPFAEID